MQEVSSQEAVVAPPIPLSLALNPRSLVPLVAYANEADMKTDSRVNTINFLIDQNLPGYPGTIFSESIFHIPWKVQ
jgi:hypothetical protein